MKNRFPVFSLAVTIFAFLVESKISSSYPNEISFDYFAYPQFPIRGVFLASNQDRFSGKPVRFDLEYDFYRSSCPSAERIVRSKMTEIYSRQSDVTPALLRLFFHDCFVHGCDASILLDDSDGNRSYTAEKRAVPNQTLKGFDKIDIIKEELEKACPGVVSCADTISLATRDGVVLAGGPFYPVLTGRRDSVRSYHNLAMIELPTPDDHLPRILHRFALKGFNERETVSLLGAHNIGQMGCDFIHSRLYNFNGTGKPDPILAPEFLVEMRLKCPRISNSTSSARNGLFKRVNSRGLDELESMNITSVPSGGEFNTHYYQQLVKGRGLLFADQQLMAAQKTERLVRAYASDDGSTFRVDFARVLMKMSNLEVLTGTQGRIRLKCSSPQSSSP